MKFILNKKRTQSGSKFRWHYTVTDEAGKIYCEKHSNKHYFAVTVGGQMQFHEKGINAPPSAAYLTQQTVKAFETQGVKFPVIFNDLIEKA